MIIEGDTHYDIELGISHGTLRMAQDADSDADSADEADVIFIDKKHAAQLIDVLTKWVDGEEIG